MIATLREIVANKNAKTLFFQPPAPPVVESLDAAGDIHECDEDMPEVREFSRDRLVVDMQTANVIVLVYDAVKPETRLKMDRMMNTKAGFVRVGEIAWKAVR